VTFEFAFAVTREKVKDLLESLKKAAPVEGTTTTTVAGTLQKMRTFAVEGFSGTCLALSALE